MYCGLGVAMYCGLGVAICRASNTARVRSETLPTAYAWLGWGAVHVIRIGWDPVPEAVLVPEFVLLHLPDAAPAVRVMRGGFVSNTSVTGCDGTNHF